MSEKRERGRAIESEGERGREKEGCRETPLERERERKRDIQTDSPILLYPLSTQLSGSQRTAVLAGIPFGTLNACCAGTSQ